MPRNLKRLSKVVCPEITSAGCANFDPVFGAPRPLLDASQFRE
jgi:hypothetical protein